MGLCASEIQQILDFLPNKGPHDFVQKLEIVLSFDIRTYLNMDKILEFSPRTPSNFEIILNLARNNLDAIKGIENLLQYDSIRNHPNNINLILENAQFTDAAANVLSYISWKRERKENYDNYFETKIIPLVLNKLPYMSDIDAVFIEFKKVISFDDKFSLFFIESLLTHAAQAKNFLQALNPLIKKSLITPALLDRLAKHWNDLDKEVESIISESEQKKRSPLLAGSVFSVNEIKVTESEAQQLNEITGTPGIVAMKLLAEAFSSIEKALYILGNDELRKKLLCPATANVPILDEILLYHSDSPRLPQLRKLCESIRSINISNRGP